MDLNQAPPVKSQLCIIKSLLSTRRVFTCFTWVGELFSNSISSKTLLFGGADPDDPYTSILFLLTRHMNFGFNIAVEFTELE